MISTQSARVHFPIHPNVSISERALYFTACRARLWVDWLYILFHSLSARMSQSPVIDRRAIWTWTVNWNLKHLSCTGGNLINEKRKRWKIFQIHSRLFHSKQALIFKVIKTDLIKYHENYNLLFTHRDLRIFSVREKEAIVKSCKEEICQTKNDYYDWQIEINQNESSEIEMMLMFWGWMLLMNMGWCSTNDPFNELDDLCHMQKREERGEKLTKIHWCHRLRHF